MLPLTFSLSQSTIGPVVEKVGELNPCTAVGMN